MTSLGLMTGIGVIALAVLVVFFLRNRQSDLLGAIVKKRSGSKLVSRADQAEGADTIPVVLWLTEDTIYYENPDLDTPSSFELSNIEEIEYADDLMTGRHIRPGCRVLRLRAHGRTTEFLLDRAEAAKWESVLRGHRFDDTPSAAVV